MRTFATLLIALVLITGCNPPVRENLSGNEPAWKEKFDQMLPLLGHRNWVLVVDKAFPLQNSPGITLINTNEKLIPVLQFVISRIDKSAHVQPVYYKDAELKYLVPEQVPGLEAFRSSTGQVLGGLEPKPILHDSVFVKIDAASKLFRIVILKTDETIPYSSVFIELGCRYWSQENEKEMRQRMKNEKTR